jgi:hypothetical protein
MRFTEKLFGFFHQHQLANEQGTSMVDFSWHVKMATAKMAIWMLKRVGWYEGYWNHWRGELFDYAEKRGLHIVPVHFYTPIPHAQVLPENLWTNRNELPGLDLQMAAALDLVRSLAQDYQTEYNTFSFNPTSDPQRFYVANSAYSCGDAELLYGMIRRSKPQQIVEVGSGYTTLLIAEAILRNCQEQPGSVCEFTAIEPYPPDYLSPLPAGVTRMYTSPVQAIDRKVFTNLVDGDILFIDSSHVSAIGSDVNALYLDVLPRLAAGVFVHIHDIFIPYEYPRNWIRSARFYWNEQYLLNAFLLFNRDFEVLLPTHAVFRNHRLDLEQWIPSCRRPASCPSSFWIRKK